MTKAQEQSLMRIRSAIELIIELTPLEQKRVSMQRKKQMEKAYESMTLHASKLNIQLPKLGTWYDPEQYLKHAYIVAASLPFN